MRRLVLPGGSLDGQGGQLFEIPKELVQHLNVLRLHPGDEVELTDGEGWVSDAEIVSVDRRHAQVRVREVRQADPPASPELLLLQGIGKGEKLDAVTRQAAELGARRLVPVRTARTVATREGRGERLRTIVDDAVRVSGRSHRMQIDAPTPLTEALKVSADCRLMLHLGSKRSLRDVLEKAERTSAVALLVGPEGGFSEDEIQLALAAGFVPVHMGPFTFRTETAGPAAVAMARYAFL